MNNKKKGEEQFLPDEKIVDLYWQRSEQAIVETDKKYRNYLYTIAFNILHDSFECEESLDDTYLGTWNTIPPNRPKLFQAFISRIMRNVAIDKLRKQNADKRVPSELIISLDELDSCIDFDSMVDEEVELQEMADMLNVYLRSLPERSSFIFICRYYYADSIKNIAKMVKMSESSVLRELNSMKASVKRIFSKR